MAVESYEQIMARLQGQQAQAPTAASDFANYVQTLMLNPNPQGNMMTDAEAYRADPFRRQNAINANLDAALKKKQMEEEAARAAAAGRGMGMMTGGGESGGGNFALTPEQEAYLDLQTQAEKDARMGQLQRMMVPASIQAFTGMGAPVLSNLTNYNTRSEELQREQARQYVASQAAVNSGEFVRAGGGIVYANPQDVGPFMPSGESNGGGWSTGGSVTDSGTGDNPNEGGYWG